MRGCKLHGASYCKWVTVNVEEDGGGSEPQRQESLLTFSPTPQLLKSGATLAVLLKQCKEVFLKCYIIENR